MNPTEGSATSSGGVSIILAPHAAYRATELVRQRKFKGKHDETLVKWVRQEPRSTKLTKDELKELERTCKEYLIWMRREEMEACCPHLLSSELILNGPHPSAGSNSGDSSQANLEFEEEGSLKEMAEDITQLVARAHKLMNRPSGAATVKVLSNTISILSAYAKIGSLSNTFRECGALDMLLKLLFSQQSEVRFAARDMLRSLTTYDLSSRSYVLLQLTKSNADPTSATTVQSRQTLLDLFVETASSDEGELLLRGITLPQIPGRFIFSLLMKYLKVTSASYVGNSPTPIPTIELDSESIEFEQFYVRYQLITELFTCFSWFQGTLDEDVQRGTNRVLKGISIFTGTVPEELKQVKKKKNPYKIRDDFTTDREYGQYMKTTLTPGMRIRARVNYESVTEGDYGVYRQTNDGTPPAQFSWDGLGGDTYWLYWHQVEILPPVSDQEDPKDVAMAAFRQPAIKQPYVMRSLALPPTNDPDQHRKETVSRPFWWEVLCMARSIAAGKHMQHIIDLFDNMETFDDLVQLEPTYSQVASVVEYLEAIFPHLAQEPLSIKEMSQFREVYNDETSKIFPARDDETQSDKLDGPFNKEAPYPDPFREEPHVLEHTAGQIKQLETNRFRNLRSRAGLWRDLREKSDPIYDLRTLDLQQDGTLKRLKSTRELTEEMNKVIPESVKVCVYGLQGICDGLGYLKSESDLQECCMTGMFTFILKMMEFYPKSVHLQSMGIQAFYALMGGYSFDDTLPRPKVNPYERKSHRAREAPMVLSDATKQVIIATVVSLATAPQHGGINAVVKAVRMCLTQYNLAMEKEETKHTVLGVRDALCIFYILSQDEFTRNKLEEWGVPEILDMCTDRFPDFETKMDLVALVANALPSYQPPVNYSLREPSIEVVRAINNEVMAVVKALRRTDDIQTSDPIPRLLKLCHKDPTKCEYDFFPDASKPFAQIFLFHHGVYYLSEAMQQNRSSRFTQDALTLLGALIFVDRDVGARLVLQGGLRALVFAMSANVGMKIIQIMCLQMLQELARDAENLCVMAAENVINPLKQCKDKNKDDPKLCGQLQDLIDLCESEETSRAFLHQKILGIVFSGVLQTLLTNIEDARRERTLIHLPKFSGLIKYLSAGTGGTVSLGEKDQWWDRVEVSSNGHRKDRLVDGDPTTFWESAGRSGSHYIRFYMKKDLVVRKMYLHVSSRDSTYMPQRVTIHGGHSPNHVMDVSTVYIPSTFNGGYEILSNCKRFYNCISISIHRCQQGGIDTRIRGVTCQAARTSLWPLFGDLFSARSRLFYFIQVQLWLRESSLGLGPLEIFDRLSSVVLYEQMFADSFLVTALARQCIGQACRSALIAPLIEIMTRQETGSPDLSKLIRDYVSEMNPPLSSQWKLMVTPSSELDSITGTELVPSSGPYQFDFSKAQERLVYMSRVRRMCRLLVDCDDNTASKRFVQEDPDDYEIEIIGGDEEDEKNLLTPGSGTMSMAKCWRDLVQIEVTQVLKKFDLKSPHLVTTDLLTIYDKLKQAMLELFGGHSQFTLALKEGFSRAFQGLDEVTAVRCCELICISIDSLMDSSGKGACRFHGVEENRKETMLLHFAEPLQFLHNLDIAHVFEHYYRRHLSVRLLRGRSVSVTLERRLALAFAHCFPHKYPLQMLQDLDSSKVLMDRFCDSELLESLDQLMVRATSQATVQISPEAIELAQKCNFYRMRHFQVYTLNPCFWPLRQRPMSVSVLPTPLSTFCEDYSRFFVAVHKYGLQQHERARRIHFTLYGWAVLVYNGLRLITSTVQMIILLQFNDTESHTLKSLHEVTQLPYEELCDALLSLTAKRQCILVSSSQPDPPNMQSEDDSSPPPLVTPFTLSTLFTVNETFSQYVLSKHKTNKVRFHDVRLVNRNHLPTLEDRTADLAHIFERRRAIMDSAIVRMLKREKEMSVDTIALKVIKGCSDGKFDRGVSFGGFDCDYRDVCSRVDRLIMDGYIRRDESEQQLLIYVPDPDALKQIRETLEAPVEESTQQHPRAIAPTQESAPSKKGTKRSTSPSTSSSKEPKSTSSPTEVSGTSLLPQKRLAEKVFGYSSKRKPPPFSRVYSTDWYNQDDAPLLGMLPTSRSLTTDEIQLQIKSLLNSVCQTLEADRDTIEHLLFHCNWKKDTLIQKYLKSREDLLLEAGLTGETVVATPATMDQVACSVCLTSMSSSELSELFCGHVCCNSCWQKHILSQIDLNKALQCSCPTYGCVAKPTRSFIVHILGDDTDAIHKYNQAVIRSYVEQSGWLTWCCNPQGCDQVLCKGDGLDTGTCSKCQWSSCFSCDFPEAHQPASCANMRKWIEDGGFYVGMDEDAQSKQLASLIAKRCPGCNAQIEKNEGCLHMKCKCGHGFCWNCMKPWKPTHIDFFNCAAKKSQAARNHRKFADYNERCAVHEKSKAFAERLNHLVKGISDSVPIKILSFLSDACQLLVQCHKMLNYSCVAEYYTTESAAYLGFLCDNLEGDTIALQAFLENTLLAQSDPAQGIRSITDRTLLDGYRLVSKIENTRDKLMIGFHQQFKLGDLPSLEPPVEEGKAEKQEEDSEGAEDDELEFEIDAADELTYVYSDYDESQQEQDRFDDTYDSDSFHF